MSPKQHDTQNIFQIKTLYNLEIKCLYNRTSYQNLTASMIFNVKCWQLILMKATGFPRHTHTHTHVHAYTRAPPLAYSSGCREGL